MRVDWISGTGFGGDAELIIIGVAVEMETVMMDDFSMVGEQGSDLRRTSSASTGFH